MSTIQLRRSTTSGNVPPSLAIGEIAINEADHQFFHRSPSGLITPFDGMAAMRNANLVINTGMRVSQESVANAQTGLSVGKYIVDMFGSAITGGGVCTIQQVTDAPAGFFNSAKISVTTADTTIAAGDKYSIYAGIEGYRIALLGFGAAGASPIAVGFWVKAHRAGIYCFAVGNAAAVRSYVAQFTVNAADTWEYKTIVIPGDTTGSWLNDFQVGMYIQWCLAVGSSGQTTAGAWQAGNFAGTSSNVNGVGATTDTFQITGVSIIPGSAPIPSDLSRYMQRTFDEELRFCQRYYQKGYRYADAVGSNRSGDFNGIIGTFTGTATIGTPLGMTIFFSSTMRSVPTVTVYDTLGAAGKCFRGGTGKAAGLNNAAAEYGCEIVSNDTTSANSMEFYWTADARM